MRDNLKIEGKIHCSSFGDDCTWALADDDCS